MKKRFSGPQIAAKLRQADVLIGRLLDTLEELEIKDNTAWATRIAR